MATKDAAGKKKKKKKMSKDMKENCPSGAREGEAKELRERRLKSENR